MQVHSLEDIKKAYDQASSFEQLDQLYHHFSADFYRLDGDESEKEALLQEIKDERRLLIDQQSQHDNGDDEWVFEYDFSKYQQSLKSVSELNVNDDPYPIFLRDTLIPKFHPLPSPEIQNPVVAAICLLNNAVIPPEGEHGKSEVLLPNVYIQGVSGSGKSELSGLIQNHYPPDRRKSVTGADTGASMVEQATNACWRKGSLLQGETVFYYPAVLVLENFYFKDLERWGNWSTQLLATSREMAQFLRRGKNAMELHTYLLKVFTSVEPLQAVGQQHNELLRRTLRVFTEPCQPELNNSVYNWSYCKEQYKNLWQDKERVEEVFFPLLQYIQGLDPRETSIPDKWYPPSILLTATGVFAGIWETVEEAQEHIARYWQYVEEHENKRGKPYIETFEQALSNYQQEYEYQINKGNDRLEADEIASSCLSHNEIVERAYAIHYSLHTKKEIAQALQAFLEKKGFSYTVEKASNKPKFRWFV